MRMYKVTFELVNPIAHPEYYCGHGCGEHPATDPVTIPDEHWKLVESPGDEDGARSQFQGLVQQIGEGELIRNPRLWAAEVDWVEFTPADIRYGTHPPLRQ